MTDPTTGQPESIPAIPSTVNQDAVITCPNCRMQNTLANPESTQEIVCKFCRAPVTIRFFGANHTGSRNQQPGSQAGDGDATCQFFPGLKAELVCDECGCFLSKRASVDWNQQTLCLPCLHKLREKKPSTGFCPSLKIWDNRALALLAILPLTLFTAPAALFVLLKYRNSPPGWVPRSSFRWWLALSLTTIVLLIWISLIILWIAMLTRELS